MTALPLRDFSDAERDRLAAIEAAEDAPESLRFRFAAAMYRHDTGATGSDEVIADFLEAGEYLPLADAALAVLRGPSSDAEQAVERVLALADNMREIAYDHIGTSAVVYRQTADRIRAAVAGPTC